MLICMPIQDEWSIWQMKIEIWIPKTSQLPITYSVSNLGEHININFIQVRISIVLNNSRWHFQNILKGDGHNTVRRLYPKCMSSARFRNPSNAFKQRTRRSDENIKAIRANVEESRIALSVRRFQEVAITQANLRRMIEFSKTKPSWLSASP